MIVRHALPNALIPVITLAGLAYANLLTGTVMTETIFSWPGLGQLVFNAIAARDLRVVQATTVLIAVTFVLMNLFVDVMQMTFDPRQKRGV